MGFFLFLSAALLFGSSLAAPKLVWSTRSVSGQRGTATCESPRDSNSRSNRFVQLSSGEYRFSALLSQSIQLDNNQCATSSSTVASIVSVDNEVISSTVLYADKTCAKVTTENQPITGRFTVKKLATVRILLHTRGGPCADVVARWDDINVIRCSARLSKLQRKMSKAEQGLEESRAALQKAQSGEVEGADLEGLRKDVARHEAAVDKLQVQIGFATTCDYVP